MDAKKAQSTAFRLTITRRGLFLVAVVSALPWPVAAALLAFGHGPSEIRRLPPSGAPPGAELKDAAASPKAALLPGWVAGKQGPWGTIESMPFTLDVPADCVLGPPAPPVRWSFPGYSKEKALGALRAAGVAEDEVKRLEASARWTSDGGVTSVEPGDPLVLGLVPAVRSKLYSVLVEFPQNGLFIEPIWFRAEDVDWRLQDSGLAPASVALLKRLLYPQGENSLLFADSGLALRQLPDDAQRTRFMRAILRKRTILVRVRLDAGTDVEKLSQYWGIGGRRKDLAPLLSALLRARTGNELGITYLLPDFARKRLNRYPGPANAGVSEDCFWSAYNFFNDRTENNYQVTHSNAGLNKDCYQILSPNQLGDLMVLTTPDGSAVHAAVYVADDIYFTKNGLNATQPWLLMHLADLLAEYKGLHPQKGVEIRYFRRKGI
jgi:hypothetical protein